MADGLFYLDTREPHLVSNLPAATLLTTATMLYPAASFPVLGSQYFNRPGKAIKIEMAFTIVTGLTPGNFSFNVLWGTGVSANGTGIMTAGTPVAATASVTKRGKVEVTVRCLTTGSAGTLEATGIAWADPGVIASTLQPIMLPTGASAASGALDLTAANIVSIQGLMSGTAGCTLVVDELKVTALN